MKKTIRFNLQFHNGEESVQIRNLDDLEENMNLNDLLDSFLCGDLERWLRQRNETERADKISQLEHNDEEETLLKLFEALNLGFPESEIGDIVRRYIYQKNMAQARHMIHSGLNSGSDSLNSDLENTKMTAGALFQKGTDGTDSGEDNTGSEALMSNVSPQIKLFNKHRFEQYKQLKEQIKSLDQLKLSAYKPLIDVLTNDYPDYFELDSTNFYDETYRARRPLAILTLLMNPKWNPIYGKKCLPAYCSSTIEPPKSRFCWVGFVSALGGVRRGDSEAFVCFWGDDYSELLDDANELRYTADKPIKWIDNNDDFISSDWKRLVPPKKKVIVIMGGKNLEWDFDSEPSDEDPFYYGLHCRRSGRRNCHTDNILIFMPFD